MGNVNVLVVDDEKTIRTVIAEALRRKKYGVQAAANAQEALEQCAQKTFNLALIDLKMPGKMDGIGLLQELRTRFPTMIVIVLTGYGTLDSAIAAIRHGAHDYISKPADLDQIIASVERGLEKGYEESWREHVIRQLEEIIRGNRNDTPQLPPTPSTAQRPPETSRLEIDCQRRLVVRNNIEIPLTDTEFDLLEYLARNSDKVWTAKDLLRSIQGYVVSEAEARPIVRVQIQRLRRKLEDDPEHPRYILNVRGRGYRFVG